MTITIDPGQLAIASLLGLVFFIAVVSIVLAIKAKIKGK